MDFVTLHRTLSIFKTFHDLLWLFMTFYDFSRLFMTFHDFLQLFLTFCHIFLLFMICRVHLILVLISWISASKNFWLDPCNAILNKSIKYEYMLKSVKSSFWLNLEKSDIATQHVNFEYFFIFQWCHFIWWYFTYLCTLPQILKKM